MGNFMSEKSITLQKLRSAVAEKTIEVLELRNETWDFLKSTHTLDEAKTKLAEARDYTKGVAGLGVAILTYGTSNPTESGAVTALMASYDRLNGYTQDIQSNLSQDIDQKQRDREAQKIDFVKNATFIFAVPAAFVTGVRNGLGHGQVGIDGAMYIGFAVSVPVVFQKTIRKTVEGAVRAINAVPVRGIAQHYSMETQIAFALTAKSVNDNVNMLGSRAKAGFNRLMRKSGPEP